MQLSSAQDRCKENFGADPGCCGLSGAMFLPEGRSGSGDFGVFSRCLSSLFWGKKKMLQCLLYLEI